MRTHRKIQPVTYGWLCGDFKQIILSDILPRDIHFKYFREKN